MNLMRTDGSAQSLGALGESHAGDKLREKGWLVDVPTDKRCGDLRLIDPYTGEILKAEIKTARLGSRNRWQFCLRKNHPSGRAKTDCAKSDVVILQCVAITGLVVTYVIPAWALNGRNSIEIVRGRESKWQHYLSDYQIMEVHHETTISKAA